MIFFESEQVIKLHSSLIAKTGGMDGIRAELIDFGLNIASGKMNKNDIKAWFLTHRK